MSITDIIMVFGFKPVVICCIISMMLTTFKKESASFQFSVIWLSVFFIPLSVVLSFLTGMRLDLQLPFSELPQTLASNVSAEIVTLLFCGAGFVGFYLQCYRWLGLIILAKNECSLGNVSSDLSQKIHAISSAYNISNLVLKRSTHERHIAYVWRSYFFGPHRLVLGGSFFRLTHYQQECVLSHECAHIQRNDWLKSEWLFLMCSTFWWVFPVWILRKRADAFAEQACDDGFVEGEVSSGQSSKKIYSKLLLSLNAKNNLAAVPISAVKNMTTVGTGSEFFNRIVRVLARYVDRELVSRKSSVLLLLIIALMCSPVLFTNVEVTPKRSQSYSVDDGFVLLENFQINTVPVNPIDKSSLIYSGLPIPKKSDDYFVVKSNAFESEPKTSIEELFTQAEFEPAALQSDLFFPMGSVQVTGFLPKRLILPEFPESARHRKISGEVTVTFSVDEHGRVKDVEFIQSNPHGIFETSVIAVLDQFWFDGGMGEVQALSFYFQI